MKKTWRKALKRLLQKELRRAALAYPEHYRRIGPAETMEIVRLVWWEMGAKLTAVPVAIVHHSGLLPPGRRAVYCFSLGFYFVQ